MSRKRTTEDRKLLAEKRLRSVLRSHGIAPMRTLEQKISDAGPFNQRIDPHVLNSALHGLVHQEEIVRDRISNTPWYHLASTPREIVKERWDQLHPVYDRTQDSRFKIRVGQTLEIAVLRSLRELHNSNQRVQFWGDFADLEEHDDSTPYSKIEPRSISGRKSDSGVVDFVVTTPDGIRGAIEVKNTRKWLYPRSHEVIRLLQKALDMDAVPILIARRIAFVTFYVLNWCGVLVHQTYNQLYPYADNELAELVKNKRLLGYHDVRVGNEPDMRLSRFTTEHLIPLLPEARSRVEEFRDLLEDYASGEQYEVFAGRVLRRVRGEREDWPEDWDWGDEYGDMEH